MRPGSAGGGAFGQANGAGALIIGPSQSWAAVMTQTARALLTGTTCGRTAV